MTATGKRQLQKRQPYGLLAGNGDAITGVRVLLASSRRALLVAVLGPQNEGNGNAARSLRDLQFFEDVDVLELQMTVAEIL